VLKFGGTSVGTAEALRSAREIIEAAKRQAPIVIVVSALSGVTNQLDAAAAGASEGRTDPASCAGAIRNRHFALLDAVAPGDVSREAAQATERRARELEARLVTIRASAKLSAASRAAVLALGERLAAPVAAAALRALGLDAHALDASDIVRTNLAFPEADVDYRTTRQLARAALDQLSASAVPVVTGFIGAASSGATTLLGRGGSDLTAAVLGWALDAERVEIWSDVDGVMTADPRRSSEARTIPYLTYAQAAALARAGAKVLHPRTLEPLAQPGIPVYVGNTLRPGGLGTWIGPGRCP
jgi:aspartate kinase